MTTYLNTSVVATTLLATWRQADKHMKHSLAGLTLSTLLHTGIIALVIAFGLQEAPKKEDPRKIVLTIAMFAPTPSPISEVISEVTSEPVKEIKPRIELTKEIKTKVEPVVDTKPAVIPKPQPMFKSRPQPKKKKSEEKKKAIPKKEAIPQELINAVLKPPKKVQPKRIVQRPQQSKPAKQARRVAKPITNSKPVRTHTAPRIRTLPKKQVPTHSIPKKKHAPNLQLERQYGRSVTKIIEQQKSYPKRARRRHKQGIVRVGFSLSRSGIISNLRIVQSSGINSLDKATLNAVRKVGRFPAFPAGIAKQSIRYIVPIAYRLN